jgi:hypothetical protein
VLVCCVFGTAEAHGVDSAQKEALSKKAIAALKAQLQALLDAPLPDAHTFNSLQKQRARAEQRGGKVPPTAVQQANAAAVKPRAGRKAHKSAAAAPAMDNSWKRRSSFFVFAK